MKSVRKHGFLYTLRVPYHKWGGYFVAVFFLFSKKNLGFFLERNMTHLPKSESFLKLISTENVPGLLNVSYSDVFSY